MKLVKGETPEAEADRELDIQIRLRALALARSSSTEIAKTILADVKDTMTAAARANLPSLETTAALYGTVAIWATAAEVIGDNDAA